MKELELYSDQKTKLLISMSKLQKHFEKINYSSNWANSNNLTLFSLNNLWISMKELEFNTNPKTVIAWTHKGEHHSKSVGISKTIYKLFQVSLHETGKWAIPNTMANQSPALIERYCDSVLRWKLLNN